MELNAVHVVSGKATPGVPALEPLLSTPKCAGAAAALAAATTPPPPPPRDDVTAGMLYYAASSVFYAGMAVLSKVLQAEGYPVWQLTFLRALVILTVSLSAILSAGGSPWGVRRGLLLLRGTLGYASITLFFSACALLPIATATTFSFCAPLIVALLSPWLLREAVSPAAAVVIPLCIGGVVLCTEPPVLLGRGATPLRAAGVAVGLAQPFFAAAVKMVIRELRKTETTQVIILYLVICTLTYSSLGCAFTWRHLVTPRSGCDCALLLGLGLCGYGNQLCTTKGLERAKAASVMSMQYCSIVLTQLAGVVLFAEYPSLPQAAGMVVIVVSMVGYLWYEAHARNGTK